MRVKYIVNIIVIVLAICAIMFLFLKACGDGADDDADITPEPTDEIGSPNDSPSQTGILSLDNTDKCDDDNDYLEEDIENTSSRPTGQGYYSNGVVSISYFKEVQSVEEIEPEIDENAESDETEELGETEEKQPTYELVTKQEERTFSVGTDAGMKDYIYLNPRCSEAADGNEIGYYLSCSRGYLEYSGTEPSDSESEINAAYSNFIIYNRLYTSLIPAAYEDDTAFGVRWTDDLLIDGEPGGTEITIRVINLVTAEFMGVYKATIGYDAETGIYSIQSLKNDEVKATGELDDETRSTIIEEAIEFASGVVSFAEGTDWETSAREGAIVDLNERAYFPRFLDTNGNSASIVNYGLCKHTYAVTMPMPMYGYMTIYFAPKAETIGFNIPTTAEPSEYMLTIYGYDPLNPRLENTIVVPNDFRI